MYQLIRISHPKSIVFKDCSESCPHSKLFYNKISFIGQDGNEIELELFFDDNLLNRLVVEQVKNDTGRGPYILPDLDGSTKDIYDYIFVDWHYEEAYKIVLDHCWYEGTSEVATITDAQEEAIIDQIYNWEVNR